MVKQCHGFIAVKINDINKNYFVILHVKGWAECQDKQKKKLIFSHKCVPATTKTHN